MIEPISERKRYYNPILDSRVRSEKMSEAWVESEGYYQSGGDLHHPDLDHPVNLVSSLCEDGLHHPALDIDIPCEYHPSSTEGHGHLYFPTVALEWEQYAKLLDVLAECGIVERTYVDASLSRGQTLLRPPWVSK